MMMTLLVRIMTVIMVVVLMVVVMVVVMVVMTVVIVDRASGMRAPWFRKPVGPAMSSGRRKGTIVYLVVLGSL